MEDHTTDTLSSFNQKESENKPLTYEGYIYDLFKNDDKNSATFDLISDDFNCWKIHIESTSGINVKELTKRQLVKVTGILKEHPSQEPGRTSSVFRIEVNEIDILQQPISIIHKTCPLPLPNLFKIGNERITVITGTKNKGYNDLVTTIDNEIKQKLIKCPVPLQNKESIEKIATEIETINTNSSADLICIVRGGGSEAFIGLVFDSTRVTSAIQNSKIPVLVAVGHADNITEADKASDAPYRNNDLKARRFFTTPTDLGYFLNLKYNEDIQNTPIDILPIDENIEKDSSQQITHASEIISNKTKERDYFLYVSYIVTIGIVYFLYQSGIFTDFYENTLPVIKNYSFAALIIIGVIIILYNFYAILGLAILYFLFQFALHLIEGSSK